MSQFTRYRATRKINIGQLRRDLARGEVVEFDGVTLRIGGRDHVVPTVEDLISCGWLTLVDPTATPQLPAVQGGRSVQVIELEYPVARKPAAPNHATPARADQALDKGGNPIPYASPAAARAAGKRPEPTQAHVWVEDGWINGGGKTCGVCGVSVEVGLIRADRQRGNGAQQFHYRDVHNNRITSFEELGCPLYLGDPGSAAALAKDQVRKVRGRVDDVEDKVETIEERLARVEAEGDELRAQLAARPALDPEALVEAFVILADLAREGRLPGPLAARLALPAPTVDLEVARAEEAEELLIRTVEESDPPG